MIFVVLMRIIPVWAVAAVAFGRTDPIFNVSLPEWDPRRWNGSALLEVTRGIFDSHTAFHAPAVRTAEYMGLAVVLCLLIGYPVAYRLARATGRTRLVLIALVVLPLWINYLMRMLGWVSLLAIDGPLNNLARALGLMGTPVDWLNGQPITVVLGLVYGYVPYFILPVWAAVDRIDWSLCEAAQDLGAGSLRTFLRVTLPLSRAGIYAGVVLIALPMIGDYYTPDILSASPRTTMIGNVIRYYLLDTSQTSIGASLALLVMVVSLPAIILYLRSSASGLGVSA